MSYDNQTTRRADMRYIRTTMDEPMLDRAHELDLASRWKEHRDEKALHELIRSYTRLVVSVAAKFKNYGLPMGDLIQEGNIGLMEAASRFEPTLENRFSTYAVWWVKAQIQDYVLRNWSIVRTGTTAGQKSLFFNLRRLRAKMEGQAPKDYLDGEAVNKIAQELDVTPKEVIEMETRMNGDWSLNNAIGEPGEGEWQDMLADQTPTPEETVMRLKDGATRSQWLHEALDTLDPRERTIIEERQLNDRIATLGALGKDLGVSKERIRQLEQRAMDKLKVVLQNKVKTAGLQSSALFD